MAGMPIAVIVERSGRLKNSRELNTTWTHEVDVCFCGLVAILKSATFALLLSKHFISGIRIKRWVNVDKIDTVVRKSL